jgi:maltose alpha-D-glucosyltransferase/alpha-amylase
VFLGDRNGVRTPMQWNGSWNSGFSEADAAALYSPLLLDAPYGFSAVNVMAQERSQASMLRWMRRAIAARRSSQVFGRGTIEFLGPENRRVLAFLREYEGQTALVAVNLARSLEWVELDLSRFVGQVPVDLWSGREFPVVQADRPYVLTFAPYGYYAFRLQTPARGSVA